MKAQEIITTDRETGCCDDCSERILAALRDAAGASDTDTITIAADGTVGRLEPWSYWLTATYPDGRVRCNHDERADCPVVKHVQTQLYRVVTP